MKYLIGVLAIILIAVFGIVLFATSPKNSTPKTAPDSTKLLTYAMPSTTISFTTLGRLVGDDDYREIRISLTDTKRTVQILSGYDQNVISTKSYHNSDKGFEAFLVAIDVAGFRSPKQSSVADIRGACPLGNRFTYVLNDGSKDVINSWSDTCSRRDGNFAGASDTIRRLFQAQIPQYNSVVNKVRL